MAESAASGGEEAAVLLGVDIGTGSSKAVLTCADGSVVATAERAHTVASPRPGWMEHDAVGVWLGDLWALVAELLPALDGPLAAIGLSGLGPCLLPTTAAGVPLRPAILYGIDTRAGAEIAELTDLFGAEEILERCGSVLTSQAVGPKVSWVRRHEPEVWKQTDRIFTASSFLVHQLTGEYILDHQTASQFTPLYDSNRNEWIDEWAREITGDVRLPQLVWPGEVVGAVSEAAAATTGLPMGTPVIAGTVDAWAEAHSVGVSAPGDAMIMYGTTMFLVKVVAERATWPTLWSTAGLQAGSYTLAAGMATSGALTDWLRTITGERSYARLTEEAAAVPRGADGLVMLPYFAGERTPLFDPDARGVIVGLTLRHGREHLYRAILEGVACGVRHNLEVMSQADGGGLRLVAVGGGTQGGLWTRIVSDVTGQPQQLPRHTIGASFGDALLAAQAVGEVGEEHGWNPIDRIIAPDPAAAEVYERLYQAYRDLYPACVDVMHDLARKIT